MLSWIKKNLNRKLRALNIEIRKYPASDMVPMPVFNLAVQLLMQKKGSRLFFIQVGANDGVFGDPLRPYVIKYAWRGILIEPQPNIFELLMENYREQSENLIFENCAVSPDKSSLELHVPRISDSGLASIYKSSVASVNKSNVARQTGLGEEVLATIQVSCKSLDSLILEHNVEAVDVLQIDAESYDYHVLRSLNLDTTKPAIIQFETGHLDRKECDLAVRLLHQAGYSIHWGGNQGDAVAMLGSIAAEI